MAETATHKNGRGSKAQPNNNSSVDDEILNDAARLLDMVMSDSPPADIKRKQHKSRGASKKTDKLRSGERRGRSPVETNETVKKQKHSLDDDGSRKRGDDDVDGSSSSCNDQTKSNPDGRPVEKTCRGVAPRPTLFGLKGRAPLAEPENSTLTPELERDMGRRMRFLKCDSKLDRDEEGDEVDSALNEDGDEECYDDVDGASDEDDEPVDEKKRAIKEIAEKLRNIGDDINSKLPSDITTKFGPTISISMKVIDVGIQELTSNLTYEKFQDVVNRSVGNETEIQQVAAMFCLARAAVKHWGSGTKAVAEVKEIALNYFSNNVYRWVSQNGWSWIAQHL